MSSVKQGSSLVFLDTETTGLSLQDDIWEIAAIRREPDGQQTGYHCFVQHDPEKCSKLPESFFSDHMRRFNQNVAKRPHEAAELISLLMVDRPHVVGAVPNFDTERLAILLRRYGFEPGWHYHLIDVENLAVGWLAGRAAENPGGGVSGAVNLPWDSDELSRVCGVEPPGEGERHTAIGDVHWAMALYDRIMGR